MDLIPRGERRRRWTTEQKQAIAAQSLVPGVSPTDVARLHGPGRDSLPLLYALSARIEARCAADDAATTIVIGSAALVSRWRHGRWDPAVVAVQSGRVRSSPPCARRLDGSRTTQATYPSAVSPCAGWPPPVVASKVQVVSSDAHVWTGDDGYTDDAQWRWIETGNARHRAGARARCCPSAAP